MVSTRSSFHNAPIFIPQTNTSSSPSTGRRTSPRMRHDWGECTSLSTKTSHLPKETTSFSPRRSSRIQSANKWNTHSSTRSGLKYGRELGTHHVVNPGNITWGDGDDDEWVPDSWKEY